MYFIGYGQLVHLIMSLCHNMLFFPPPTLKISQFARSKMSTDEVLNGEVGILEDTFIPHHSQPSSQVGSEDVFSFSQRSDAEGILCSACTQWQSLHLQYLTIRSFQLEF